MLCEEKSLVTDMAKERTTKTYVRSYGYQRWYHNYLELILMKMFWIHLISVLLYKKP